MNGKARKNLITLVSTGLLLTSHVVFSQTAAPSMPMVTAEAPKASMMNRYGNYPVNLYTGLVDITVPVFEIETNGLKIPVEFKYHASGLKFDDMPMELGYGWTLKAGGIVSHGVRGTPKGRSFSGSGQQASPYVWIKDIDEIQNYLCTTSTTPDNDQIRLIYIDNGVKYPLNNSGAYYCDSEYDVYDYNFLHHSGQMYYIDGNSIKVPTNGPEISPSGSVINAVDNEGISYVFSEMEYDAWGFNEVFYLTKIISANKADTVIFDYTNFNSMSGSGVSKPVIDQRYEIRTTYDGYISDNMKLTGSSSITSKTYYPPRLNFIKFRGGKIDFIYTNTTTSRNLSEIKIYDNRNVLYRTVKLLKPRTDWLDGIEFRGNTSAVQQTYAFEYYQTNNSALGIDYWGYYNGASVGALAGYVPDFTVQLPSNGSHYSYTIPGTNRTPNSEYMKRGTLTKIVYPTKGYTVFEYEAHKADNRVYGGLRIKEIRNYDHNSTLVERKWYKYGVGESGNGRAAAPIYNSVVDFYQKYILLESVYGQLTKKHHFTYYYPLPVTNYYSSGSSVLYPYVTEYTGTGSVSNGKTVYQFTDTPDEIRYTRKGDPQPQKYKSYQWQNGLLEIKSVYNSNNQVIDFVSNNYSYLYSSETLNLGVRQYADITGGSDPDPNSGEYIKNNLCSQASYITPFSSELGGTLFDYYNYYITTGLPVITSSVEYRDGVTKTVSYSDYKSMGLPGQMQVTNSDGNSMITKYKYPTDLSSTAPYNLMVANNILTPVIHQEQYKGTNPPVFLSKSVNEYKNWGNNLFEPEIIKIQATASSSLENRITYHNRDTRGNPRYISKDNAEKVVYIWGYNSRYPIAEITGVTYSDVKTIISENALNTIAAKNEPDPADMTTINNLRTQLPDAMVTTCTFKPLVGILTMTDPRGVVTDYNYDAFGRLTSISRNGKTIESYQYHYKN